MPGWIIPEEDPLVAAAAAAAAANAYGDKRDGGQAANKSEASNFVCKLRVASTSLALQVQQC